MLQLSHQPHPLPPNPTSSSLHTHPLSPQIINAILTSPYSRYSKLSTLVSQAQSLLPSSSSSSPPQTPITISLPPFNPAAITALLTFLQTSDSSSLRSTNQIRKGDVQRAFEVLGVDYPPGFDHYGGMGDGVDTGEQGRKYTRTVDDYSSSEVYEARLRMEREEGGFSVSFGDATTETATTNPTTTTTTNPPTTNPLDPPSYFPSTQTQFLTLSEKNPASFHNTLHSTLLTKLSTLLLSHIHPLLTAQATSGLFRGTFILLCDPFLQTHNIPLTNLATSSPHDVPANMGGYRQVINLPEGFTPAFLTQEVVVDGLRKIIGGELGVVEPPPRPPTPPPREPTPPPPRRFGFFGFGKKKQKGKEREEEERERERLEREVVQEVVEQGTKVDVRVEDVWVRWDGEDGLVKTRGGKGLVVWVEVLHFE